MTEKKKFTLSGIFPFLGLVVVALFFGIAVPVITKGAASMLSAKSINSMLNDGLYILIGAIAYAFVMAEGEIDFSIGAVMALSCAVAGYAAKAVSPWAAIPAVLVTGALIGTINSLMIVKVGVNSFITTLSMQYICNGMTLVVLGDSILSAPLSMLKWYNNTMKITLTVVFLVVGYIAFEKTRYGKSCKAIGSQREAARQSGIPVTMMRMLPYIILGMVAGILGLISLTRTGTASSQTGASLMMNVLNAALIGGVPFTGGTNAKFRSVVIGALTMTILTCGMTMLQVGTVTQFLVKGLVFLVAVSVSYDRSNVKVIK